MKNKSKMNNENFEWSAEELTKSKIFKDLPESLQAKLASRKLKEAQEHLKHPDQDGRLGLI